MNKDSKRILKCLYDLNKARNSISRSLNDINTNTGIDSRIIDRETDYLKQKGYIEKNLITTTNISAYAFRITAQGIDIIESKFFKSAYLKILIWFLIVGIPTLVFYLDLLV